MPTASRKRPKVSLTEYAELAIGLQLFGMYLASAAFLQSPLAGLIGAFLVAGIGLCVATLGRALRSWAVIAFDFQRRSCGAPWSLP